MKNKYLFLSKLFKVICIIFLTLATILIFLGGIGILFFSGSLWQGFKKLLWTFSPLNILNFIMVVLTFIPALIAYKIHKYFEVKNEALV